MTQLSPPGRGHAAVAAIVLAAGLSRRMGPVNKLLQPVRGVAMVRKVAEQALASGCGRVLVVLGHQAGRVREALAGLPVEFIDNPDYAEGLGGSVRAGAAALRDGEAALVCLGDMPGVTAGVIDALLAAFRANPGARACQPVFQGRRGNPVLWSARDVPALRALRGDEGARALLRGLNGSVLEVPVDTDAIFMDIDTPQALQAAQAMPARPARCATSPQQS